MKKLIQEELRSGVILASDAFWVLQKPGTNITIMAEKDGKARGPITFVSEDDALSFQEKYGVDSEFEPTFCPPTKPH